MQELDCALSHNIICLCVRFTLSARITREVNIIIEKVSTIIKAFRIEFTSFGIKKQKYPMAEQESFMSQN